MRGYNRVILKGNLTKDPEVRYTPQKQKVAKFTVAVGRQWKDKETGEQQSHTDFINTVAWGVQADIAEKYLKKGNPVLVEGRLSVRNYDDQKTGQKRWITEVVISEIVLLGGGKGEGDSSARHEPKDDIPGDMGYTQPAYNEEFPLDFSGMGDGDVDIPF